MKMPILAHIYVTQGLLQRSFGKDPIGKDMQV